MPNGRPALWHACAAARKLSSVHFSAWGGAWHRGPVAGGFAQVFGRRVGGTVLADQLAHDVVDGLEKLGVVGGSPASEGQNVVPGLGLGFGLLRQQQLVALRGDVVDLHLDSFARRPLLDQQCAGGVGPWHPMIPQAYRQLARGMSTSDIGHRNHQCGRCAGGQKTPSRRRAGTHGGPPFCIGARTRHGCLLDYRRIATNCACASSIPTSAYAKSPRPVSGKFWAVDAALRKRAFYPARMTRIL
jgi:hypothetical protein